MNDKVKLGKYKHFKGHIYEVVGTVRDSETMRELVLYMSLYKSDDFGDETLWVRPIDDFYGLVDVDGVKIERFKYIE